MVSVIYYAARGEGRGLLGRGRGLRLGLSGELSGLERVLPILYVF